MGFIIENLSDSLAALRDTQCGEKDGVWIYKEGVEDETNTRKRG